MPKTPKSAAKARPKPVRSPNKKVLSAEYVDDEADESDDGVLVDSGDADGGQPSQLPVIGDRDAGAATDEEYDRDFINDGDPFADVEIPLLLLLKSVRLTESPPIPDLLRRTMHLPHLLEFTEVARPNAMFNPLLVPPRNCRLFIPSLIAGYLRLLSVRADVIELADTSDEDLTAMDVDDSVFKKPGGVKASALPPSLLTRSAAAKKKTSTASDAEPRVKEEEIDDSQQADDPDEAPALVDGVMNAYALAMVRFVNNLFAQHSGKSSIPAPSPVPASSGASRGKKGVRVDHDAVALNAGMVASLHSPIRISKGVKKPRYSPDWDPPPVSELLDDIGRRTLPSPRTPVKRGRVESPSTRSKSRAKGKGKATQSSEVPALEDVPSDEWASPPKKKKIASGSGSKAAAAKPRLKVESPDPEDDPPKADGSLSSFLVRMGYPVVPASGIGEEVTPLTMAQFQRVSAGEMDAAAVTQADEDDNGSDVDTVFLEDIEVYRVYFNSKARCGVFDLRLQAPSLRHTYLLLHPLPANRRIVASYDRNRNSTDDIDMSTGGRVNWESWYNQNPRMLAANSVGAMVFVEAKPNFVNVSRISPLRLNTRVSTGSSSTYRLHIDDRVAICVSAMCTTESFLVAPKRIGLKTERMRKWVSGVFHDQEWERFESAVCLLFHEQMMYSQITNKALSFQTMISPENTPQQSSPAEQRNARTVPSSMFSSPSPVKSAAPARTPRSYKSSSKTLLAYNDPVPIYDARKTIVNFEKDLSRLDDVLPLFPGEIPVGSFTVVGYTLSSYMANLSGTSNRVPHVGCNVLWAIVCGTPYIGGNGGSGGAGGSGGKGEGGSRS
ncbi:hypothetical protein C8R46DRAFT_1209879 [Mycena filopes]|nr:hypothetical protein C8R46DRAFT_1209879 [Mycena filopes]